MPDTFQLHIPVGGDLVRREVESHTLKVGEILFVLGANGTGKSSLFSAFLSNNSQFAKRISAHRQTWFVSNALDMTPRSRDDIERHIRSQDQQVHSRYRQDYAAERASLAIYDLIDKDTMEARRIAEAVRSGDIESATATAKNPSPLQVMNELMRLSNISVEISLEERERIVARRNGGPAYSVAELSDGERNAFLIVADVLTAPTKSLILIDEPERHLHRSIISPLLTLLFEKRQDCAFVVSTHELMLPVDNPTAKTLLVRSCTYEHGQPLRWDVSLLEPSAPIEDELKRDILGARQKMIFVEGTSESLDAPLYSLIFPQISVIPKSSCRDVEQAVRGLRAAEELHWVQAWGIVDNDRRSSEDIHRLKELGIHALSHFSVESLYFHPEMIRSVAKRQCEVTGDDPNVIHERAIDAGIGAAKAGEAHLVANTVERLVRSSIFDRLPTKEQIHATPSISIEIDVEALRTSEKSAFEQLIASRDLEGLLARYPLRKTAALDRIASAVGVGTRERYEAAVRTLLQKEPNSLSFMRGLFGSLYTEVIGREQRRISSWTA